MTTITTRPQFLNANSGIYTAWDLRENRSDLGAGVADYESFRVMQRQGGADMSVDVGKANVGLMQAWVRGSNRGGQGLYRVDNIDRTAPTADTYVSQLNVAVTSGHATLPRLDQVVLEVLDAQHSGASNLAQLRVVEGTPSSGATLDNRTGAASLPSNCILLADILVPANESTSIENADIRDRRHFPLLGTIPPLLTDTDQVALEPHPFLLTASNITVSGANHDLDQVAALCYLRRRIVGATRIKWTYGQGGATGSYNLGIYDASGRKIVETGATALSGLAGIVNEESKTITATTFEPGAYYVVFGVDFSNSDSIWYPGIKTDSLINGKAAGHRNLVLFVGTGGTTLPTTILGGSDQSNVNNAAIPAVPLTALAVE